MNLAEANYAGEPQLRPQWTPSRFPSDRWEDFPYSRLSDHSGSCCRIAREWTEAMDFAQLDGGKLSSGPRWLRAKYKWGPSGWPMHWCEVVQRDAIDCGAHAALSLAVFQARGLTAFPAQLVQRFDEHATAQWGRKWAGEGASCHWLSGTHIYHEGTALLMDRSEVKLWDASAGSWIDPRQSHRGYGSVAAVRIFHAPAELDWGGRKLSPGVWNQLE